MFVFLTVSFFFFFFLVTDNTTIPTPHRFPSLLLTLVIVVVGLDNVDYLFYYYYYLQGDILRPNCRDTLHSIKNVPYIVQSVDLLALEEDGIRSRYSIVKGMLGYTHGPMVIYVANLAMVMMVSVW